MWLNKTQEFSDFIHFLGKFLVLYIQEIVFFFKSLEILYLWLLILGLLHFFECLSSLIKLR